MNSNSRPPSFKLGKKLTFIPLLGILALIFWVDNSLIDQYFPSTSNYTNAEIRYEAVRDVDIGRYIVREGDDRFLLAASTHKDLYLSFRFTSPANLTMELEPSYQDSGCADGGVDEATISFSGDNISQSLALISNQTSQINVSVSRNQLVSIAVQNRYFEECGKVYVNFIQRNDSHWVSWGFGLIWLFVFIICLSIRTSTLIAPLGATYNALFLWAESTLGLLNQFSIGLSISISITFAGLILVFTGLPVASKIIAALFTCLLVLLLFLPIAVISHELIFTAPINEESIHAVLQSYLGQTIEFWGQFVGFKNTLYVLIGIIIIYLIVLRLNHFKLRKTLSAAIGFSFLFIGLTHATTYWHDSGIFSLIDRAIKIYRFEIESFQSISLQRKKNNIDVVRDPAFNNNTTVFVIGESVNRNHMSAYGYLKKTTPLIDERIENGNVIKFSNVFSNHTHSNPTISFLLTQANQYNEMKWLESPSIINVTNALSIESSWLTNHRLLGGWSNYITAIAQDAGLVKTINNKIGRGNSAFRFDGDLLPLWRDALREHPNQASFLHLYNSHIDYCSRYPESADVFDDQVTRAYYGEWTDNRKVGSDGLNCYDNSIYYTDQILEEIIQDLDNSGRPSVLVYIPDHSDDVLQAKFHNAVLYTHAMTTVPLFIWANQEWQQQHAKLWQNLLANKDKPFTNDLLFESMAGLLGISAQSIDKTYDFSSDTFNPPNRLKTIHGRRIVNEPLNWRYWQPVNAQKLMNSGYQLGATNIDSVAKAKIALNMGFELLEIQMTYSELEGFQISDNEFNPIGIELRPFLQEVYQAGLKSVSIKFNGNQTQAISNLNEEIDRLSDELAIDILLNDESITNNNIKELGLPNLLKQEYITQFDKSKILMLDLVTQFDVVKAPITEN